PTWDVRWYVYPTLPANTVAAVAALGAPAYRIAFGRDLRADLSPVPPLFYEHVEPGAVLLVGRLICLVLSLLTVLQIGVLARRLAGPAAGWLAAWCAAVLPALVVRGAMATIDDFVTLFVLVAIDRADRARLGAPGNRNVAWAGVATGLA